MDNLFREEDFALFRQYANIISSEAPEGHTKLRTIYDKLGQILDVLKSYGYHTEIIRNPLRQGGPGVMKYAEYHWSRIYPVEQELYDGCCGKVFFVLGTTADGVNIHIDSYSSKDYSCNNVCESIKDRTWMEFSPKDASQYTCSDWAQIVDEYIKDNWKQFNLFAKEFGIKESIKVLNKMNLEEYSKLLLNNHNIVLTGAPGTGKTYMARMIAKQIIGCKSDAELETSGQFAFVQFHPSYDYTDFVEGLRPRKSEESGEIGFELRPGIFKMFCEKALKNFLDSQKKKDEISFERQFEKKYNLLLDGIRNEEINTIPIKTKGKAAQINDLTEYNNIRFKKGDGTPSSNCVSLDRLMALAKAYRSKEDAENMSNQNIRDLIGGCNSTWYWAVLNYIYKKSGDMSSDIDDGNIVERKNFIFLIDEINRGEISKIFGELFFSIDEGYRGIKGKVKTQYHNMAAPEGIFSSGFYIPENVYIIGTMNDIDRSVESMDFAIRRRFAWKEISVESTQSMLDDDTSWGDAGKPSSEVIDEIKIRMNNLNAAIIDRYKPSELTAIEKIGLTKAYQIGASYFLKYNKYNSFDDLWTYHLEGLLLEYLRGTTNVDLKINRLKDAYNDTIAN